jgi:hypothetical protein
MAPKEFEEIFHCALDIHDCTRHNTAMLDDTMTLNAESYADAMSLVSSSSFTFLGVGVALDVHRQSHNVHAR